MFKRWLLFLSLIFVYDACTSQSVDKKKPTVNVSDTIRVISLSPSTTELIATFKSDKVKLIGRTEYCNYPSSIKVVESIRTFPLDIEKIITLQPQYVFVKNDMIKSVEKERLTKFGIEVIDLPFDRINDIKVSIEKMSKYIQADSNIVSAYIRRVFQDNTKVKNKFSYMAFASTQPYYVFSQQTFFSELAQLEGGENAITSSTAAYPEVSLENIILNNPEHIFVADSIHYFNILHQKQLQKLKAVQQKKIHCIPTDILSRPGSRMDSLRWWIHQSISNE